MEQLEEKVDQGFVIKDLFDVRVSNLYLICQSVGRH